MSAVLAVSGAILLVGGGLGSQGAMLAMQRAVNRHVPLGKKFWYTFSYPGKDNLVRRRYEEVVPNGKLGRLYWGGLAVMGLGILTMIESGRV